MKNTELQRGQFNAYYEIKNLKMADSNRDMMPIHSQNFKTKLNEYGWLMPIVISDKGDVIEGHHRIESAKLLKQKTIPAYVINWVDTKIQKEHLDCIISLNNGNKAWKMLDYLKAFSDINNDYLYVYDKYLLNQDNITVGNIINLYFKPCSPQVNDKFKKGELKLKDKIFSDYLLNEICELVDEYSKSKVVTYCIREFISLCYGKAKKDKKAIQYLIKEYKKIIKINHPASSSIKMFKPIMINNLKYYNRNHK
jgi:hypothetical protein